MSELGALGISGLPLVMIEHPLGGERSEGIARRARQAVDQLVRQFSKPDRPDTPSRLRKNPTFDAGAR